MRPCGGFAPHSARGIFAPRSAGERMRPRGSACCFGEQKCPCSGRLTYFLAALSALQLWDILCPCIAREHPLGRGGKRKSEQKSTFPLSQSGFPSRSFSPQPSPPCRFFLWSHEICPIDDYTWSNRVRTPCRSASRQSRGLNPWLWAIYT